MMRRGVPPSFSRTALAAAFPAASTRSGRRHRLYATSTAAFAAATATSSRFSTNWSETPPRRLRLPPHSSSSSSAAASSSSSIVPRPSSPAALAATTYPAPASALPPPLAWEEKSVPPEKRSSSFFVVGQRRPLHSSATAEHDRDFLSSPDREVLLTLPDDNDKDDSAPSAPGIATLTLNRPKSANALGRTMLSQLQQVLTALEPGGSLSSSVRVVILTSSHPKVFSAGADLRERATMTQEEAGMFVSTLRETFGRAGRLPMPVIAAVEGAALGGGLELALTADVIVAGPQSKFGLPETSLAIIPGAGGTVLLPRKIGVARAKELIFTARRIGPKEALDYGVVEYAIVEEEAGEGNDEGRSAEDKANDIALEIAKNGPLALRAAKRSIAEGMEKSTISEAMEVERKCYGTILDTEDRLEGLAAFRERRTPKYKGR